MKTCPVCNTSVVGRADKRYCSADCRAHHHNKRNRKINAVVSEVNRKLKRNRMILASMSLEKKVKLKKEKLYQLGYHFDYFTQKKKDENGCEYLLCYDQAFELVQEEGVSYVRLLID